jgi:hypothetical protein
MSFSKNRSGVPYLKFDMPRVLLPGEPDSTSAEEKQEVFRMVQRTLEDIMARHNTAFLNIFQQMMVGIFGPGVNKHFEGELSAAVNSQPVRQDTSVSGTALGVPLNKLGNPHLKPTTSQSQTHLA